MEAAGNMCTEDMDTGIEDSGEHGTEERKGISQVSSIVATHT